MDVDRRRWSCYVYDNRSACGVNRSLRLEQRGPVVVLGLSFLVSELGFESVSLVVPVVIQIE